MTLEQLVALISQLGRGQTISLSQRDVLSLFDRQTFAVITAKVLEALDSDLRSRILVEEIGDEIVLSRRA